LNSLGAMQGGAVATVIDAAAETAIRAATSERLVVTDLQITYLALGGSGRFARGSTCSASAPAMPGRGVELVDAGAESRLTSVARVVATRSLRDAP